MRVYHLTGVSEEHEVLCHSSKGGGGAGVSTRDKRGETSPVEESLREGERLVERRRPGHERGTDKESSVKGGSSWKDRLHVREVTDGQRW